MMVKNYRSVSIRGVFNYARARALWADGLLRVFTVDGPVLEIVSEAPVPKPGYRSTWTAETAKGQIVIKNKCITCGGKKWWRVTFAPTEELWEMAWQ